MKSSAVIRENIQMMNIWQPFVKEEIATYWNERSIFRIVTTFEFIVSLDIEILREFFGSISIEPKDSISKWVIK